MALDVAQNPARSLARAELPQGAVEAFEVETLFLGRAPTDDLGEHGGVGRRRVDEAEPPTDTPPTQSLASLVDRHPREPPTEALGLAQGGELLECTSEGFLRHFLGVVPVKEDAVAHPKDAIHVTTVERLFRPALTSERAGHEDLVTHGRVTHETPGGAGRGPFRGHGGRHRLCHRRMSMEQSICRSDAAPWQFGSGPGDFSERARAREIWPRVPTSGSVTLELEPFLAQRARWPQEGRQILAQFDDAEIVIYLAFKPSIARAAVANGHFEGSKFSFSRLTWLKPSFLWIMYRSGWATKRDMERVLAVRLERAWFDAQLAKAVPAKCDASLYPSHEAWCAAAKRSEVRVQWEPDHDPCGTSLDRRAIQLGLRGASLEGLRGAAIRGIEDITDFAREQSKHKEHFDRLTTPAERPYPVASDEIRARLGLDGDKDDCGATSC